MGVLLVANWMKSGWGYRVNTQEHLLRTINRIGTYKAGRRFIWRGVSDASYDLQSSLGVTLASQGIPVDEAAIKRRETEILSAAREWPLGAELGDVANDLHMLAMLQHHGAPTRLVDVTSNPSTALWFACGSPNQDGRNVPGVLFAFDVTDVPEYATANRPTTYGSLGDPLGWPLAEALKDSSDNNRPFLVRPSVPDTRMRVQEGAFIAGVIPPEPSIPGVAAFYIAHGDPPGTEGLRRLFDPVVRGRGRPRQLPFVAIVITARAKVQIRRHLAATYNRRRSALFPDVDGFVTAFKSGEI